MPEHTQRKGDFVGIRKSVNEQLVVSGSREEWLNRCQQALAQQKFKKVAVNKSLGQVRGDFKQLVGTLWGDVVVTLVPEGQNTRLDIVATANVDNVYALGGSPGRKLIDKLKQGLGQLPPPVEVPQPPPPAGSAGPVQALTDELAQLAGLHERGALTDSEFAAAKSRVLGQRIESPKT